MNLVEKLQSRIREYRKRIVIIGDVMTDRWVHGHLVDCQDGCKKFVQDSVIETPGGAANAERSISYWMVGSSLFGHWKNNCGTKTRFVDQNNKIVLRHDCDIDKSGKEYDRERAITLEWVECAGGVLLSDYDKGFLTLEFIKQVVSICRERKIPCVADCKRTPEVYTGCIMKGNQDYWSRYCFPNSHKLVMTRGETGPYYCGATFKSGPPVNCVNHVGAGDCFSSHLTLALAYGFSMDESITLAHSAGRVYVQHPHNRPPLPTEIAADLITIG